MDVVTSVIYIQHAPKAGKQDRRHNSNNKTHIPPLLHRKHHREKRGQSAPRKIYCTTIRRNLYNKEPVQQVPIATGTEQQTTELSMDEGDDPQKDNTETTRMGSDEKDDAIRDQQPQHHIGERTALTEEEREQMKPTIQRRGGLRSPRVNSETDSWVHQQNSAPQDTIRRDKEFEELDTDLSKQNMEGTREDIRHSPKRPKKMKIEKTAEPQPKRTRNATRQAATKHGKKQCFTVYHPPAECQY
jgi:hypothetical protein